MRQAEENSYKQRQQVLMSRGVTREHVALLPRDPLEPMPSQITNELEVHKREALRDEMKRKMQRAVEAFENPWLVQTEKELQEYTVKLTSSSIDQENRASMHAYLEVLQDKLKNFHCNLGTLNCEFALDGRRRWCMSQGLLKKDQRHLVTNLSSVFLLWRMRVSRSGPKKMATKQLPQATEATHLHRRVFHLSVETAVTRKFSSCPSRDRFVFHARSRHFRGPHADQYYTKKTQVWRTNYFSQK